MIMHTVPNHLRGASLGEAHKWVREQMVRSNPSKPSADYTLSNESGSSVNLSDITSGKASHITINAAGGVRSNPAHPAELRGFMEVPKPMHASRLTALTQDEVTPALWHSMVNQYGLFGATQTLSILLTRPISPSLRHTAKTMDLIRARKGETLLPIHQFMQAPVPATATRSSSGDQKDDKGRGNFRRRTNPRPNPTPAQTISATSALGLGGLQTASSSMQRAGILNLDNDRVTADIRREVDRVLDGAEGIMAKDGEDGALVSMANKMSLHYENSEAIFNNFATNVLGPYLVSSTANLNALKYINEYILPKMREVIMDGRGSKDKKLRKLDRQYRHIVEKLATDPKDFYMGSEFALVAHPAFLFPRSGLVLMPIPNSTKDMAFRAFEQAGTPPTYDPGTGFVATAGKSDKSGVTYIGKETFTTLGNTTFGTGKVWDVVAEAIESLTNVVERVGETDSTGFNVITRGARSMAALTGAELHKKITGTSPFFFVDLPGIRPIPTNWPQGLVMAMMETLGKGRDRITGLNGAFNTDEFLTPSGINLGGRPTSLLLKPDGTVKYALLANLSKERQRIHALVPGSAAEIAAKKKATIDYIKDIIKISNTKNIPFSIIVPGFTDRPLFDGSAGHPAGVEASSEYLAPGVPTDWPSGADFLQNLLTQDVPIGDVGPGTRAAPLAGFTIPIQEWFDLYSRESYEWLSWYSESVSSLMSAELSPITTQSSGVSPSAYQIMVDSVELSMKKYNYEPSKDDIYFTMILLYYSLKEMGLDTKVTSFMGDVASIIAAARQQSLDDFQIELTSRYPVIPLGGAPAVLDPAMINNWLALQFAYDAFNDPTSDAFRELTGVRVNPGIRSNPATDIVSDAGVDSIKHTIKKSLDSYQRAVQATGNNTQAEEVVTALRTLIMPSILKQMKAGNEDPLFVYAGDKATESDKLIEIVNSVYGQSADSIETHIMNLLDLTKIVNGTESHVDLETDLLAALNDVRTSTSDIEVLGKTAEMMDDFVKFMPKGTSKREKKFVKQLREFMLIIDDSLTFKTERLETLTEKIRGIGGAETPTGLLHDIIVELESLRSIVASYDHTIEGFQTLAAVNYTANSRYDEVTVPAPGDQSGQWYLLSAAHDAVLLAIRQIPSVSSAYYMTYAGTKTEITIGGAPNPFSPKLGSKINKKSRFFDASDLRGLDYGDGAWGLLSFKDDFEDSPKPGEALFDLVKRLTRKSIITADADLDTLFRQEAEKLVDSQYRKYKKEAQAGQVWSGAKRVGAATRTGLAWTGGALLGGTGGALVGGGLTAGGAAIGLGATAGGALAGGGLAAGGNLTAAGGAVLGSGLTLGGAAIGLGATAGGALVGTGLATGGGAIGLGKAAGGGAIGLGGIVLGTGIATASAAIAGGLTVGFALLNGGWTIAKLASSTGVSAVLATVAYYQNRRELKRLVMEDPAVIQQAINDLLSKKLEKETNRRVATNVKEKRAIQLEVDMLDLGAQRLRLITIQAKAEARTASYDADTAQDRLEETELNRVEAEIALKALVLSAAQSEVTRRSEITMTELDAEADIRARMSASNFERETRRMGYDDLAETMRQLKETRGRFIQSIGSRSRAKQEQFKPMSGEMAAVYGNQTPALRLLDYDKSINDMELKLQGMA